MGLTNEWRIYLIKDSLGEVTVSLYEMSGDEQFHYCASETFGPFDTATDVTRWIVRHWAPRARFPLR